MADTPALFSLQVIASNKVFYDEHAQYLKINTSDGFRGLMAHHAPCVVAVETGPMETLVILRSASHSRAPDLSSIGSAAATT